MDYSFKDMCGICLEKCDTLESYSEVKINKVSLLEIIKKHILEVDWSRNFGYPDKACSKCTLKLTEIHKLGQICVQNRKHLEAAFKEIDEATRSNLTTKTNCLMNETIPVMAEDSNGNRSSSFPSFLDFWQFGKVEMRTSSDSELSQPQTSKLNPKKKEVLNKSGDKKKVIVTITSSNKAHGTFDSLNSCQFCFQSYEIKHDKMEHEKVCKMNPNRLVIRCDLCLKQFCKVAYLKRHIKEIHLQPDRFKCVFCDKKFSRNYMKKKHEAICQLKIEEKRNVKV